MDVQEMIASVGQLVSLPEVWRRVNEVLEDPNSSPRRVGDAVALDPGLTARILKVVNSAYYGLPCRVETVAQAISIIGTEDLRHLVLATSVMQAFERIPTDLVDMGTFWHHSVCCALGARLLCAHRQEGGERERSFVAGLLHDVGQLVLYQAAPELTRRVLVLSAQGARTVYDVEKDVVGWTHAEVGAALLAAWNLPRSIGEAVRCHHEPHRAREFPVEAAIVHIANGIANGIGPGRKGPEPCRWARATIEAGAWERVGVDPNVEDEVREGVAGGSREVLEAISPRHRHLSPRAAGKQ